MYYQRPVLNFFKDSASGSEKIYLHALTFFNDPRYYAKDPQIVDKIATENKLDVLLEIGYKSNFPQRTRLTAVSHLVDLSTYSFLNNNGTINVVVEQETNDPQPKNLSTTEVKTLEIDDDGRPAN